MLQCNRLLEANCVLSVSDSYLNVSDEGHGDSFLKLVQRGVQVQDFHYLQCTHTTTVINISFYQRICFIDQSI